jgi:hypothetical protein
VFLDVSFLEGVTLAAFLENTYSAILGLPDVLERKGDSGEFLPTRKALADQYNLN